MIWDASLRTLTARLATKLPPRVAHPHLSITLLGQMPCLLPTIPRLILSTRMRRSLRLTQLGNARYPSLTLRWQLSLPPRPQEQLTAHSSRMTTFLKPTQPNLVFPGSSSRRRRNHKRLKCPHLTPCFSLTSACSRHKSANTQSSPCLSQLISLKISNLLQQRTTQLVFKMTMTQTTISSRLSFLLIFIDES